jgi:hypothetical protein
MSEAKSGVFLLAYRSRMRATRSPSKLVRSAFGLIFERLRTLYNPGPVSHAGPPEMCLPMTAPIKNKRPITSPTQ